MLVLIFLNVALSLFKYFSYLKLGEMETDEPDDESSQDQELPSENENSQSEDSVGGDNDSENGLCTEETCKGQLTGHKKRLFTFQFNNLGNTDINYIKDDTRHIRFDDRQLRLDGKYLKNGFNTKLGQSMFFLLLLYF